MAAACRLKDGERTNLLLPAMVIVFVFLHIVLFRNFEDRLATPATVAIELSLETSFKPTRRQVPRPPRNPMAASKPLPAMPVPAPPPVAPAMQRSPEPAERPRLPAPVVPDTASLARPAIVPLPSGPAPPLPPVQNPQDYFNLIRSRIDANKIYPETARKRRQEGSVIVRFVVAKNGQVTSVEAIGGSRLQTLRAAATDAVMRASPFPRLPESLGKDRISIKLTIHFELDRS